MDEHEGYGTILSTNNSKVTSGVSISGNVLTLTGCPTQVGSSGTLSHYFYFIRNPTKVKATSNLSVQISNSSNKVIAQTASGESIFLPESAFLPGVVDIVQVTASP